MEKIQKYHQILTEVLENYVSRGAIDPNAKEHQETRLIIDKDRGHYQVTRIGWKGIQQFFVVIFHFDLIEDKNLGATTDFRLRYCW